MERAAIHNKFVKLGKARSGISHQLLALLPEIFEEEIFRDYGCGSIYEYAARFGDGLSAGVVNKVLKLKANLAECPALFETVATQGVHKVAIVAGLASAENEQKLIDVVENMSKAAVQEYSKKRRGKVSRVVTKIEMDEEMEFLFLKLKKKFKTISNKETMKRLLQALDEQLFPAYRTGRPGEKIGGGGAAVAEVTGAKIADKEVAPRHVSKKQEREVRQQTNGRCAYDGCNRPIDDLHHPDGYSKTKNHRNLVGLCNIHHQFAHNGIDQPLSETDVLYRRRRRVALV